MTDVCGIAGFAGTLDNTVLPLAAMAAVTTGAIIGATYAVSQALNNPKVAMWAKTEAVQVVVSLVSVLLLLAVMDVFCSLRMDGIASLFGISSGPLCVYDAAGTYLTDAAQYSLKAVKIVRYHLEAYNVLSALNGFECEFGGIGCLFGYSGTSISPLGGYGAHMAALDVFLNSSIMSAISALNFLFILIFVYKGFVLLFLPLGIFLRSMPYLRSFGALLMAVSVAFLVVYPFLLSMLYLMEPALVYPPAFEPPGLNPAFFDESIFEEHGGTHFSAEAATAGPDAVAEDFFPDEPHTGNPIGAMRFAASAFIAAVFLPTAVLIATVASIAYVTRFYGEEIDLSRIMQMV
ncbi:hypothetical protein L0Y65_00680 [Candidatus Micrarchaeota archaeon]|nr:hypothetical protein [Candidatus Micrarchaeota archaeon]